MLDHGGRLREAAQRFGRKDWIDLSTGLNPHGYPPPVLAPEAWHRLPEDDDALLRAACTYYRSPRLLAVAGTQAAIQALPRLRAPSRVVVAAPSYAEHAHNWGAHGHTVREVPYAQLDAALSDCDVMVVCNPNNPTGACIAPGRLRHWASQLAARGGWLVVDEAFGDTAPHLSVAPWSNQPALVVLHSIGKFFGLAGARVGFVGAPETLLEPLADLLGPWTVSGPAQQLARAALEDRSWQQATRLRLEAEELRLRALLNSRGIAAAGTPLFQWWQEAEPEQFWQHMAERGLWVRLFTQAARGIRIGLPPDEPAWKRLDTALTEWNQR